MQSITELLTKINELVWRLPLICLLLGTGVYFTYKLKLLQLTKLKLAFKCIFKKQDNNEGDVSSFQALCTALSSTIGTGNIVGVATAIAAGGPGALFWMWISAFFGMATKYAEGLLAVRYRVKDENNQMAGGPMYYLERGLGNKWLAKLFAFFGVAVALLGIGTFTQVRSISDAMQLSFNIPPFVTAIILTVSVGFITIGGIKRIANVAEKIIPLMCVLYISGVIIILVTHINVIPGVIILVIKSAFNPQAALGGGIGFTMTMAMQKGISRGIFLNESGLGSAPIAAAAKSDSCVEQGLVSMTGTFIDTVVICSMTGLAILLTNSHTTGLEGAAMTTQAFTTIIGWNYYGERCMYYLKGLKVIPYYKFVYIVFIAIGAFMSLHFIFILADIVNGCMAIPNLIGLLGLRKEIVAQTQAYFKEETITQEELATTAY